MICKQLLFGNSKSEVVLQTATNPSSALLEEFEVANEATNDASSESPLESEIALELGDETVDETVDEARDEIGADTVTLSGEEMNAASNPWGNWAAWSPTKPKSNKF